MLRCPWCSSQRLHRPPFRWPDVFQAVLLRTPFRCNDCGERFSGFRWAAVNVVARPRRRVVVGRLPKP